MKEPGTLESIPPDRNKAPGWELYIRRARDKEPDWVALLQEITADRLPRLRNASTAAVLFVPASERLFAYCFGHGHTLLRADSYETDFGLRVALNSIDATISFPPCRTDEDEEAYNLRVAQECGWACTDRKLVTPDGAQTRVELCDLFTPEWQFIHVKPRSRSSTLSHLFAQGLVSAESLLSRNRHRSAQARSVT